MVLVAGGRAHEGPSGDGILLKFPELQGKWCFPRETQGGLG